MPPNETVVAMGKAQEAMDVDAQAAAEAQKALAMLKNSVDQVHKEHREFIAEVEPSRTKFMMHFEKILNVVHSQGLQRGTEKMVANVIPWHNSKLFKKTPSGKKWNTKTAMVTLQCCYHLMNMELEEEVMSVPWSLQCVLHHTLVPSIVKVFEFGQLNKAKASNVVHNKSIWGLFKREWSKIRSDGRGFPQYHITGDGHFLLDGWDRFTPKMDAVRRCWEPANAWMDDHNGEMTQAPLKLKPFLKEEKERLLGMFRLQQRLDAAKNASVLAANVRQNQVQHS